MATVTFVMSSALDDQVSTCLLLSSLCLTASLRTLCFSPDNVTDGTDDAILTPLVSLDKSPVCIHFVTDTLNYAIGSCDGRAWK